MIDQGLQGMFQQVTVSHIPANRGGGCRMQGMGFPCSSPQFLPSDSFRVTWKAELVGFSDEVAVRV